ncbi:unnamed protein product, partial [Ceratitis capitata]
MNGAMFLTRLQLRKRCLRQLSEGVRNTLLYMFMNGNPNFKNKLDIVSGSMRNIVEGVAAAGGQIAN